jgi:hypothetical protein
MDGVPFMNDAFFKIISVAGVRGILSIKIPPKKGAVPFMIGRYGPQQYPQAMIPARLPVSLIIDVIKTHFTGDEDIVLIDGIDELLVIPQYAVVDLGKPDDNRFLGG